jgi:hypothetical protein
MQRICGVLKDRSQTSHEESGQFPPSTNPVCDPAITDGDSSFLKSRSKRNSELGSVVSTDAFTMFISSLKGFGFRV